MLQVVLEEARGTSMQCKTLQHPFWPDTVDIMNAPKIPRSPNGAWTVQEGKTLQQHSGEKINNTIPHALTI